MTEETTSADILGLTAEIVAAHVSNNTISGSDVPALIASVFGALSGVGKPEIVEEKREPAVSIRSSIKDDYLVCLEDGAKLKMLKRYLKTRFDMTPDQYRAKWNLPRDYPMVAPAYAATRKALALKIGLGRKKAVAAPAPKSAAKARAVAHLNPVTVKAGRPKKVAAATE